MLESKKTTAIIYGRGLQCSFEPVGAIKRTQTSLRRLLPRFAFGDQRAAARHKFGSWTRPAQLLARYAASSRSNNPFTFDTCHVPPRRVTIPRTLSCVAIARSDLAPSARMSATTLTMSAANIGPNLSHQNRTVSWQIYMQRTCRRSSSLRRDSGNRKYIFTARRMTSGFVLRQRVGEQLCILGKVAARLSRLKPSSSDNTDFRAGVNPASRGSLGAETVCPAI